mmetsp:Transcript_19526/g.47134  ORF Transcript_19526/g.47134 Transcript_19526/m.47134 type:complete len:551 (-) Transcript_19526:103-1755(-)
MKFASAAVAVILQGARSVSSADAKAEGSAGGGDGGGNDRRWIPLDDGGFNIDRRHNGGSRQTNQRRDQGLFLPAMNGSNGNNINNKVRQNLQQKQLQLQRRQGQGFGREGHQLQLQNRFQRPKQQQPQQLSRPVVIQECSPDLGILACGGLHEYCVSSSRSTTGGFCMDFAGGGGADGSSSPFTSSGARINVNNRLLQNTEEAGDDDAFNNNNNNNNYGVVGNLTCSCTPECYYPYQQRDRWEGAYYSNCQDDDQYRSQYRNCTCTNVDRDNYTLKAECTSGGYGDCFQSFNLCGINYTSCPRGFSNTIEIVGEGAYFSERCEERNDGERCSSFYEKRDVNEGTYIFKSCNFFGGADVCNTIFGSNETYAAEGCEIEVNGETCSSCDVVDVEYDSCKYYSNPLYCSNFTIQCYEFDCTNTDWNRTGSSCNRTYEDYVYYGNTDGCEADCNVCGDDANMTLPDEYFEIPFYGRIKCSQSQARASSGLLSTSGCAAVQLLAFDACGCVGIEGDSSRSSSPEIVPSGAEGQMRLSELVINLGLSAVIASSLTR